jgi:hypothetical protein
VGRKHGRLCLGVETHNTALKRSEGRVPPAVSVSQQGGEEHLECGEFMRKKISASENEENPRGIC